MSRLARLTDNLSLSVVLVTFGLGGICGLVATWLGLPLGMLLGPMIGITLAARLGLRVKSQPLAVPQKWRSVFIPIVGVAIGASFPADFVTQAQRWWMTMAALVAFIPLAQFLGYQFYRRVGQLTPSTAYYAAMPGGFIEALDMGERDGADMPMLIMLQFLRLILCIVLIPIVFSLIEGHAVGSAAGVALTTSHDPLTVWDVLVLTGLGAAGYFTATLMRLPAAVLSGPLLFSGIAHATGFTHAAPPFWAVLVTQWVMGTSLGVRLSGFTRGEAGKAVLLSSVNVALMLVVAAVFGWLLADRVGQPISAVILAFAPGGVSEMALVALSLHLSAVFVTMHHLARILLAVTTARLGTKLMRG
ncbi:AbrB family transcriptional regulator [Pararhodobacter zhoushanensis]|uniref:AbrB family transcriptional regulator n=1 Tax=Pararhodobacter zhoushanensis TaxID=2479545 RepID=A0ABT3GV23_9RHOB|nr:AbrB family transcriptional regulator [Pararhodobacter zhoushanensis]MCW1931384.1 AbrB family transcriptional regulator [Pararhodobacter zhoushanensis]